MKKALKQMLCGVCSAAMLMGMTACGSDVPEGTDAPTTQTIASTESTAPTKKPEKTPSAGKPDATKPGETKPEGTTPAATESGKDAQTQLQKPEDAPQHQSSGSQTQKPQEKPEHSSPKPTNPPAPKPTTPPAPKPTNPPAPKPTNPPAPKPTNPPAPKPTTPPAPKPTTPPPTQPPVTEHTHTWVHEHTDEVGHWGESKLVCQKCGWYCTESQAAAEGIDVYTYYGLYHQYSECGGSYDDRPDWVVDVPASDKWTCSGCGDVVTEDPT